MGHVYRATHLRLLQTRALKLLLPHFATDRQLVDRFEREARLAAQLDHPNIVRVLDVGEDGAYHFLAMELLDGDTLRHRLRTGGFMELPLALSLIGQLADALDYAHSRGIAHR